MCHCCSPHASDAAGQVLGLAWLAVCEAGGVASSASEAAARTALDIAC
jgi:hypothetical protein